MMKVIAFGASYSKDSINKRFAAYASSHFKQAEIEVLDLNSYPLPLFTPELEQQTGAQPAAKDFIDKLGEANLIVISLSEHNGSYTAAFKNLFDWASRVKIKMFEDKKVLLLSTAPGPRGGLSVLETAQTRFPIHGADIVGSFSLPQFSQNFSEVDGITDPALRADFQAVIDGAINSLDTISA